MPDMREFDASSRLNPERRKTIHIGCAMGRQNWAEPKPKMRGFGANAGKGSKTYPGRQREAGPRGARLVEREIQCIRRAVFADLCSTRSMRDPGTTCAFGARNQTLPSSRTLAAFALRHSPHEAFPICRLPLGDPMAIDFPRDWTPL